MATEPGSKFRSDGGDAGSKTVYILLPYYQRGNLQDAINANLVNHTRFPEEKLMVLLLGVAKALKSMHQFHVVGGTTKATAAIRREGDDRRRRNDDEPENEPLMDDEVTQSQEGVQDGGLRPYAHRDVKPGVFFPTFFIPFFALP